LRQRIECCEANIDQAAGALENLIEKNAGGVGLAGLKAAERHQALRAQAITKVTQSLSLLEGPSSDVGSASDISRNRFDRSLDQGNQADQLAVGRALRECPRDVDVLSCVAQVAA
jgi:hypothetical protein